MKNARRPLDPTETSYIIRARIEGVSTLTYAFNSSPQTEAMLVSAAAEAEQRNRPRGMQLSPSEISQLIGPATVEETLRSHR